MARWGDSQWMSNPVVLPDTAPPTTTPYYSAVLSYPPNGSLNVPRSCVLRAYLVDPANTITNTDVYVDGTLWALGDTTGDLVARQMDYAGRHAYEVYVRAPFEAGSVHLFEVRATDGVTTYAYRSQFTVAPNSAYYTGNAANTPETRLQAPYDRFLGLESLRLLMLQVVLDDSRGAIANRGNVAARALYQLAYDTELSALLNPYYEPDGPAQAALVPVKRSTKDIESLLAPYDNMITAAINTLFSSGALPSTYKHSIADARDSLLYTYRVSVIAVVLFLARGIEDAAAAQ